VCIEPFLIKIDAFLSYVATIKPGSRYIQSSCWDPEVLLKHIQDIGPLTLRFDSNPMAGSSRRDGFRVVDDCSGSSFERFGAVARRAREDVVISPGSPLMDGQAIDLQSLKNHSEAISNDFGIACAPTPYPYHDSVA
jgi:hypothetical protein